jgi:hypothetical protein
MAGCGQQTYPVSLFFKLADGSPLTVGAVFVQHATDPAVSGGGPIEADGRCRPVLRGQSCPGLPAGTYLIAVAGPMVADSDVPSPRLPFALSHTSPTTSNMTVQVGPRSPPETGFTLAVP